MLILCSSCGGGGGGDGVVVDTLASGAVRVRNVADPAVAPWRLTEGLRLGSVSSDGPDQFGQIRDVTADALGRIYVLESQAKQVRVFEPDGHFVRSLGHEGQGPGELANPIRLEWGPDDALWIVDFGNKRYEVFDTTGVRLASYPILPTSFGFGNRWAGGVLFEDQLRASVAAERHMVRREFVDGALSVLDTLTVPDPPGPETIEITVSVNGGSFKDDMPVPLAPVALIELDPNGEGWWVSDPGLSYRIARLSLRGDTLLVIEQPFDPLPVTDEAWARALEQLPEGADVPEERRADVHPPVTGLYPGRDGLLVRRQVTPDRVGYDAFERDGRFAGRIVTEVPLEDFRLMAWRDGALYGVIPDELDIPYVVRLDLSR